MIYALRDRRPSVSGMNNTHFATLESFDTTWTKSKQNAWFARPRTRFSINGNINDETIDTWSLQSDINRSLIELSTENISPQFENKSAMISRYVLIPSTTFTKLLRTYNN
jgi:hypothetical protein